MGPYIIFSLGCENNVLSEIHEIQGKFSGLQAPHYEPKLEIWFTYIEWVDLHCPFSIFLTYLMSKKSSGYATIILYILSKQ